MQVETVRSLYASMPGRPDRPHRILRQPLALTETILAMQPGKDNR